MNMSYCRFQNTLLALKDCTNAASEEDFQLTDLSHEEFIAFKKLAKLAQLFITESKDCLDDHGATK